MADTPEQNALETYTGDERIIEVAKARWQRCQNWESTAQARWVDDAKFANADPDNGWQWPNYLWSQRRDDPNGYKPRLTVNKVRQHNLQITNDARQNKPGIKISPVGDEATFEAAKIWQGIVRHIERVSKAGQAYATASDYQVQSGLGFIRVVTDYVNEESFDQEIFIRRVKNPLNVFLDPDHNEVDGSDARFAFFFDDIPRTEFLAEYPAMKDKLTITTLGNNSQAGGIIDQDHVRVVEYFVKEAKRDKLVLMENPDPQGESDKFITALWSKIPKDIRDFIEPASILRSRVVINDEVRWYKIAGEEIVERSKWPGRFIPIVPVIGEEIIIGGQLDRKGHTRALKDAQRMYNFWTSNAVEQVALQTKSRWFVPVGASENLETYWRSINTQNYPFIPYNAYDQDGNQLPAPTPIDPPTMADAYIKGMMVAQNELMMASGQREENFGQQTNAISGRAINERQRQGDNATYHFIDNLAIAIRQVGNIILDVAPHVYTRRQVKQILAEDGSEQLIRIDPSADVAYAEQKDDNEKTWVIFNPKVGRYWVDSEVGPSYDTKRQEAWNAFVQITSQNQQLVTVIGDLMFRNADFPGAEEIADRLKRLVPPQVLGDDPSPALLEAQKQMKALQGLLAEMTEKLAKQELDLKDKRDRNEIEMYRAENDRLKQAGNAQADLGPEVIRPIVAALLQEMLEQRGEPAGGGDGDYTRDPIVKPGNGATPATAATPAAGDYRADPIVSPAAGDYRQDPIVEPAGG